MEFNIPVDNGVFWAKLDGEACRTDLDALVTKLRETVIRIVFQEKFDINPPQIPEGERPPPIFGQREFVLGLDEPCYRCGGAKTRRPFDTAESLESAGMQKVSIHMMRLDLLSGDLSSIKR